jgi:hypothetical protein
MGELDPAQLRISDEDRHKVSELLREAAGEGRLDLEELDERLEAAYRAKVYGDLVPLLADLPASGQLPVVHPGSAPVARPGSAAAHADRHDTSMAVMGNQDRVGVWQIGPAHTAFTMMGGIRLDLRQVVFGSREVVINANAIMGSVDIVVNASTRVSVDGVGIMGDFSQARDRVEPQLGDDSPLVRVKGVALMGSVSVARKPMPGERRALRGRR